MRPIWAVVRREFLERVRTKGFVLGTIAVPVLGAVLIGASGYLASRGQEDRRELAVVDLTGFLADATQDRLESAGYTVELFPADSLQTLDERVLESELYGVLILDDLTLEEGMTVFRGRNEPGTITSGLLRAQVVQAVLEVQLQSSGSRTVEVDALMRGGALEFEPVGGQAEDIERRAAMVAGLAGAMMLYMSMLVYGIYVLRSVLEEKRNRVVEVVISSIRPWQLMLGKIIGVGAVGLTQMGIWIGSFAILGVMALPGLAAQWPALAEAGDLSSYVPSLGTVLLFGVFFVLGYFLYSSLFAAVGAICTRDDEAQQAQFPVVMLLVIPFLFETMTLESSGFEWLDWAALFPFFSPIMMFPRAVAGTVPVWMVALSIVLMIAAMVATAWVAGRIYRVGILMQGKRATVPEILRWVREG